MNTITTHCEYAENAPSDPELVLNPPVDSVVSEWFTASNRLISPSQSRNASMAVKIR